MQAPDAQGKTHPFVCGNTGKDLGKTNRLQEVIMKNMVDVCAGKMTIQEVTRELIHYMLKSPQRLVIDIKRKKGGYRTTIYIPLKDFKETC